MNMSSNPILPQQQQQNFNNYNNNQQQRNMKRRHPNNNNNNQQQQNQPNRFNKNQQRPSGGMQPGANLNTNQPGVNMNPNPNDLMFNQQQQQQQQPRPIVTNRPRNLVSIVTSVNTDEQIDDQQNNYYQMQSQPQQQQQQQRGVKRSYNNTNMNMSAGYGGMDANMPQQQQQHQGLNQMPALLPTPMNQPNANSQLMPQYQAQQAQASNPNSNKPILSNPPTQQTQQSGNNNTNTTLVVKKVPADLNRVEKMQQHFSKFGQILDIQCPYDSPDASLIKFATNQQAFAAYKCPQPVFNNRFIRLYWLNNYQKQQQQQQQQNQQSGVEEPALKKPAKDRLAFSAKPTESVNKENQIKSANLEGGASEQTEQNKSLNQESAELNEQKSVSISSNLSSLSLKTGASGSESKKAAYESSYMSSKQIIDENQKKTLLLKMEVQQKARELIEKQIKDQKLLLQKFEQAKTVEEKSQILNLVKKLSESIEKEKEILKSKSTSRPGVAAAAAAPSTVATAASTSSSTSEAKADEAEKAESTPSSPSLFVNQSPFSFSKTPKFAPAHIIPPPPHHLKLNNKRLNNSTNFLKKTSQASKPFAPSASKAIPNPAALYSFSRISVDNRPRGLLFTGVENSQEKTMIVNFVNSLGCMVENVEDQANDTKLVSFVILFATRKDAEIVRNFF